MTAPGPAWWQHATCDEWLEAAKSAALDQGAHSTTTLSLALIAAAEALIACAHIPSQEQA